MSAGASSPFERARTQVGPAHPSAANTSRAAGAHASWRRRNTSAARAPTQPAGQQLGRELRVEEREAPPRVDEPDLGREDRGRVGGVGLRGRRTGRRTPRSGPRARRRSQAWATSSESERPPWVPPTITSAPSSSPTSVRARWASVTRPASGHTHTPGAGEPSPAHASWVRSWWRRARWASGTLTTSTSQRPSHGTRGRPVGVDPFRALGEQPLPGRGQRPADPPAGPLGDDDVVGRGAGERLAGGLLLDPDGAERVEQRLGPDRLAPGEDELPEHGQQQRARAGRGHLAPPGEGVLRRARRRRGRVRSLSGRRR